MTEKETIKYIEKWHHPITEPKEHKEAWKGRIGMTEMQIWMWDIILKCILIMWSIVNLVAKIINIIRGMDRRALEAIAKGK